MPNEHDWLLQDFAGLDVDRLLYRHDPDHVQSAPLRRDCITEQKGAATDQMLRDRNSRKLWCTDTPL